MKEFLAGAGVVVIIVIGVFVFGGDREDGRGSVVQGGEYVATSTASNTLYGAFTGDQLLKTGWGTFGSVIITGANTGIMNIYNATTSDVTKRTNAIATSTILMASFPANTVVGTYTFDVVFTTGLLVELESGLIATTTITYR